VRSKLLVVLLVATTAGSTTAFSSNTARQPAIPPAARPLAVLVVSHVSRQAPRSNSQRLRTVAARRPITGEQTVLPVLAHATDHAGRRWLQVRLPGRPNGQVGWIVRDGTIARSTRWRLVVDLAGRTVTAYEGTQAVRTFRAVVGKPSTPTPQGMFFIEEAVALPASAVGAPFALALSARSVVLQEFDGGPGQIAIHGLANIGGTPGSAASHGCIRLTTAAMTWLVTHLAPGVPVTIRS
jgi:lipoprotein-anchoring transpeptidase ErfK/SrfK